MRTKIIFLTFLTICFLGISAQNVVHDTRLETRYSIDFLNRISEQTPVQLELLNFTLDNIWYVDESINEKIDGIPYLYYWDSSIQGKSDKKVTEFNLANFNIMNCYYEQGLNNRNFYRINNTVIGIYSNKEFVQSYNEKKGLSYE